MQVPVVAPAPLVSTHAAAFRDLFENRRQFAHDSVLSSGGKATVASCLC